MIHQLLAVSSKWIFRVCKLCGRRSGLVVVRGPISYGEMSNWNSNGESCDNQNCCNNPFSLAAFLEFRVFVRNLHRVKSKDIVFRPLRLKLKTLRKYLSRVSQKLGDPRATICRSTPGVTPHILYEYGRDLKAPYFNHGVGTKAAFCSGMSATIVLVSKFGARVKNKFSIQNNTAF